MPISGKPEIGGAPRNDGEEFFRSLSLKLLCLRARDRGLHLVRVRAFCAAPVESRGHVKVVLPRLHAAVCIRGAHNQCGVDLAVRTPRNRSAVHVVTADSARTASAPRELHLMLRSCRSRPSQRFNRGICLGVATE